MDNQNEIKRNIFVDLDGVLINFDQGFYDISNGKIPNQVSTKQLWEIIDEYGPYEFFSNLPWMPDGKELWNFIVDNFLIVKILSSIGRDNDGKVKRGKLSWLNHNIPNLQPNKDILFVHNKRQKQNYCKSKYDIMVDDHPVVIEDWPGVGILHKTSNQTIQELQKHI